MPGEKGILPPPDGNAAHAIEYRFTFSLAPPPEAAPPRQRFSSQLAQAGRADHPILVLSHAFPAKKLAAFRASRRGFPRAVIVTPLLDQPGLNGGTHPAGEEGFVPASGVASMLVGLGIPEARGPVTGIGSDATGSSPDEGTGPLRRARISSCDIWP